MPEEPALQPGVHLLAPLWAVAVLAAASLLPGGWPPDASFTGAAGAGPPERPPVASGIGQAHGDAAQVFWSIPAQGQVRITIQTPGVPGVADSLTGAQAPGR